MSIARMSMMTTAALVGFAAFSSAAALFSSNGESLSTFTTVKETSATPPVSGSDGDATVAVVDYMATYGIPEAPGMISGSAATTGIAMTSNKGDTFANVTGVNLLLGATPITFTGTHTLEYYVWMNVPTNATGTSEYFSSGVARTTTNLPIYQGFRTSRGNGGWFSLDGDNGLATDYRQLDNGTAATAISLGDSTSTTFAANENSTFTNKVSANAGTANDAGNEWVKVDLVFNTSGATPVTSVYLNGALFSSLATTNTSGIAWLGYEDGSSAIGTGALAGVFDNIQVFDGIAVPEPTSVAVLSLLGTELVARRRRA